MRIDTTGGGGWGDPLDREPELVALDVLERKVSAASAEADYGVILNGAGEVDTTATERSREQLRNTRGPQPLFDRGPGYRRLAGKPTADVDWV